MMDVPGCFPLAHIDLRAPADVERGLRFARLLGATLGYQVWDPHEVTGYNLRPGTLGHHFALDAAWRDTVALDRHVRSRLGEP